MFFPSNFVVCPYGFCVKFVSLLDHYLQFVIPETFIFGAARAPNLNPWS